MHSANLHNEVAEGNWSGSQTGLQAYEVNQLQVSPPAPPSPRWPRQMCIDDITPPLSPDRPIPTHAEDLRPEYLTCPAEALLVRCGLDAAVPLSLCPSVPRATLLVFQ
jgi:hypothetical protein